jgi:thiol-disulfide isomerase/thioredoxin
MPKAKGKPQSLYIKSKSVTKNLDGVLSNGCGTVVVILASWCGACKRALPMWLNQLKKKNEKNVVLVDNELLPETKLSSLNISHFPSTFEIPAGGKPTLLNNPQNEEDMNSLVNSNNKPGSLAPTPTNPTNVVNASKFMSIVNSKNRETDENTSDINTMKNRNANVTNSLSNFQTEKGFTPSMGKSLEKLKGGRRTRRGLKGKKGKHANTRRRR